MRSQLQEYGGDEPMWGLVGLLRDERFTGQVLAGDEPRVRLFVLDGRIYFAERDGDAALPSRLVELGALSAQQLARGATHVTGSVSLARLFQRDPSIDRDAVETAVAGLTEQVLSAVAAVPAGKVELHPLQHHPAGIHSWHTPGEPTVVGEPTVASVPVAPAALPSLAAVPTMTPPPPPTVAPITATAFVPPPFDLPKLAATPFAVNEVRAAAAPAAEEPEPEPVPVPVGTVEPQPVSAVEAAPVARSFDAALGTTWPTVTHNLAAVEIWEMVDELLGEQTSEPQLVPAGPAPKSTRGWRRGRRG